MPVSLVELNVSFKKPQWNLKGDIIGAWQKNPLYGDNRFIESPSKNQKFSEVNMKSTISHDFPGPDLLKRPKLTETDLGKKGRLYWTLPHPYNDIQSTTRGRK